MSGTTTRRRWLAGAGALGLTACGAPARASDSPPLPLPGAAELEAESGGALCFLARIGGRSVGWRTMERATYCSTFKLFLAAATLQRVDQGLERLDRAVPIRREDLIAHAPVTGPAVGEALTLERLCQATVEVSDNPAANILVRELGGLEAWRRWWPTALYDRVTRVDRLEPELNLPDPVRDTTTPAQTVVNLDRLLLGDLLSPASRERAVGWLVASPTGPDRIKAGAPSGAVVGHKTGTWIADDGAAQTNDVGFVRLASGETMLVAAYHRTPAGAPPASRAGVIAEAVRRATRALGA